MHSDPCSDAVGRDQDREPVAGTRESDDLVPEHVGPEGGSTIDIVGTQDNRPEAQHDASLVDMTICRRLDVVNEM
jgi:hypothetical protein